MKKLLLIAVFCWLGIGARADAWLEDLPKALAQAKAEKKLVLMDFTGSNWCPPCKELHKKVLATPEFLGYAKSNVVLVVVDFPVNQRQSDALVKANDELKDKYAVDGFPTLLVVNSDGKVLDKKESYEGGKPDYYIAWLETLKKKSAP